MAEAKAKPKIRRKVIRIPSGGQMALFQEADALSGKARETVTVTVADDNGAREEKVRFVVGDPSGILISNKPLDDVLINFELTDVFHVKNLLQEQDWKEFTKRYKAGGRPGYHPSAMVGLILFGIMEGRTSLRQLETMARADVRCWWLMAGIFPDHSKIGQFMIDHQETLTVKFFESLTKAVLKRTGTGGKVVAVDGTVIQAAASNFKNIRREAAEEKSAEARQRAKENPADEKAEASAQLAEEVAETARERERYVKSKGGDPKKVRVNSQEPEARNQPLKNKVMSMSYKPTVMANEQRIVTSVAVHPTSETEPFKEMLEQSERTSGKKPDTVLADSAWCATDVIKQCVKDGIEILTPSPRDNRKAKVIPKKDFKYDGDKNVYQCPGGYELVWMKTILDRGKTGEKYGGGPCRSCPLKPKCCPKKRRIIVRYGAEEEKNRIREYLDTSEGAGRYSKRSGWVEPVFSDMIYGQGLRRFHRVGLNGVRLEFALHAAAHNIRRMLALGRRKGAQSTGGVPSPAAAFSSLCSHLEFFLRPRRRFFGSVPCCR